jgi:hypothetical protein
VHHPRCPEVDEPTHVVDIEEDIAQLNVSVDDSMRAATVEVSQHGQLLDEDPPVAHRHLDRHQDAAVASPPTPGPEANPVRVPLSTHVARGRSSCGAADI